ncbi:unnamed protein product [Heligmosomoides polygyrus]|uniref:Nuclear transcription factor Y subunit n=1 Tax=Heligmosomoides polygyrus TaxID=6339 RepID=A0A183GEX7_HELPZ|nr:unnamed protein product [Heligmosomoides polygyrus]
MSDATSSEKFKFFSAALQNSLPRWNRGDGKYARGLTRRQRKRKQERVLKAKRRCDKKPKLFVIQDLDRQYHNKPITFNDARAADRRGPPHRHDSRGAHRHPSPPPKKHTDKTGEAHTTATLDRAIRREPHRRDDYPLTGGMLRRDPVHFRCISGT